MIPLLADAIAQAVRTALAATDDHWVRLECPPHFPVESGLTATDVQRVGRLQQFEDVEIPAQIASSSPSEITAWRNGQDKVPTVVIGAATGAEEAGLRRTRVVSLAEIIETWRALLSDSMASLGDDAAPEPLQALVEHLLVEAGEGKMDAVELDGYFQRVLSAGRGIIAAAGTQLPRIGLARDAQLLGAGSLAARLQLNRSTVDLLAYPAVGPAEERLLRRLEASGAEVARAAQEFRRTLNGAVLDRIELADLRAILDGNRTPGSPRARRLLDYLDAAEPDAVDAIVRAVQGIASDIRLDGQVINASEPVDVPGGELRIQLEPHDDSLWVESDLEEPHADEEPDGDEPPTTRDQVLIGIVEAAEPIDGPDQARLTGSELLELAVDQDRLDGHSRYEPLVRAYLEARQAVVIVARLLVNDDESVLDLLIVKPEASDAAQRYVESWLALLHAAREAPAPPSLLSERLPLLDARWGVGHYDRERLGQLQWARLAPFHPWRLAPLVALARHARSSIGTPQLGSQLRWALDRAVPAYPLVWTGRSALARTGYADGIARYEAENDRTLVRAASGAGLVNVVRSFIEFHPYARDGLALTLVNPPAGGGIPAAIRDLEGLVSRLDVRVATTVRMSSENRTTVMA